MVSPDAIRTVIGVIGNGTALVLFLSPVPTFYQIWKKKTVEQYSAVPYLATLLNCMMWVLYGLPLVHPHSMLVITINGTGMVIELAYIALFLTYSVGTARRRVLLLLVAEVAFVAGVAALVLSLAHTHDRRSMVVGILCVLFGTGMYAAPLSVMKMVIQTKSVEYMPLFLSVASLVNGICWTAYALIRFDLYITIPNGLGVMFAVGQIILYAIYYKSTQQILEARKRKAAEMPGQTQPPFAAPPSDLRCPPLDPPVSPRIHVVSTAGEARAAVPVPCSSAMASRSSVDLVRNRPLGPPHSPAPRGPPSSRAPQ